MSAVPTSARPLLPLLRKSLRRSAVPKLLIAALLSAAIPLSHRRFLPIRPLAGGGEGAAEPGLSASSWEHAAGTGHVDPGSRHRRGGAPERPIPPLALSCDLFRGNQ